MSVVYFIRAGEAGPIKIGTADDLTLRLFSLQTGCPDDLVILASVEGGREQERGLHIALAKHRKRGEWFHAHADVFNAIDAAKRGDFPALPERLPIEDSPEATAQQETATWLRDMIALHRISARAWAEKAGLGKDTVSRAINPAYPCTMTMRSIARLKAALA